MTFAFLQFGIVPVSFSLYSPLSNESIKFVQFGIIYFSYYKRHQKEFAGFERIRKFVVIEKTSAPEHQFDELERCVDELERCVDELEWRTDE